MDSPLPMMRGKYCRRSRPLNFAMQVADALLSVCRPLRSRPAVIAPPRRLLISNFAHLGDLVVATSLLPVLKSAFPECEIGFLIGSWSEPVLRGHPLVDKIHILDHWAANRTSAPRAEKMRRYMRTRRQALGEVRAARYDAALDLCWAFPNTLPFLWQARIPTRIGYSSGAFGPLATHCLEFDPQPLYIGERHFALAQTLLALTPTLPGGNVPLNRAAPILPPVSAEAAAALDLELQRVDAPANDFCILHAGAGNALNVWPSTKWRALAERLIADGQQLIFTGMGEKDAALIQEITSGLSGCVSLCGRLGWNEFVVAISRARLLVCVDTVAAHIAEAVGTPYTVIVTGRHPYLWHPRGQGRQVVTHSVPCAPCHRGRGCAGMECIRDLEVERVYQAGRLLLDANDRACARP